MKEEFTPFLFSFPYVQKLFIKGIPLAERGISLNIEIAGASKGRE
jgi:hypothetical protein